MTDNITTTTDLATLLREYTVANQMLADCVAFYQDVFDQWEARKARLAEAESLLKETARTAGHGIENDLYTVTVQPKMRKWYDADIVLQLAPYVAQMPGVMEVNRERISQLAKAKAVPAEVAEAAYREEAMTAAVTIKRMG